MECSRYCENFPTSCSAQKAELHGCSGCHSVHQSPYRRGNASGRQCTRSYCHVQRSSRRTIVTIREGKESGRTSRICGLSTSHQGVIYPDLTSEGGSQLNDGINILCGIKPLSHLLVTPLILSHEMNSHQIHTVVGT